MTPKYVYYRQNIRKAPVSLHSDIDAFIFLYKSSPTPRTKVTKIPPPWEGLGEASYISVFSSQYTAMPAT